MDVLVGDKVSPHHFNLRVSHIKRLREADLTLWLGPEFETFLVGALKNLPQEKALRLLDEHEDEGEADHDHSVQPHPWLDPLAAATMAEKIAERIGLVFESSDFEQLNDELALKLDAVKTEPFVVYHPGYDQWVARFGLNQVGWVQRSEEQPPSAAQLYRLQQVVSRTRARCLFVDASHRSPRTDQTAQRLGLRVVEVDILGVGAGSYAELLHSLADNMSGCLAAQK